MKHIFIKGKKAETLVLFHGTGGNEKDLLELAKYIDPNASYLGLLGNVKEGDMHRFFKRKAMGVLDVENMIEETKKIMIELEKLSQRYSFNYDKMIAVGYSNGANMIASLLMEKEDLFKKAILFNPMYPRAKTNDLTLSQANVFISYGLNDNMIPKDSTEKLIEFLLENNANVALYKHYNGHQITREAVDKAKSFYGK